MATNSQCSFFHSSAWAKVLWETYHYRPSYFALVDNGRLLALVAMMEVRSVLTGLRGVSLPFTDYCVPAVAEDLGIEKLLEYVKQYGRQCRWRFIEIRGGQYPGQAAVASFYVHRLNLTSDTDQMFSGFEASKKRNIRKAVREGVEVNICRSVEAVREYYRLHCITRKRHGLPPQPRCFFEKIYEHIISANQGFVALGCRGKTSIAGSVFFNFQKKSLYKFGASDHRYQHLRANDLVMWESMKWYAQNGYVSLSLGRTAMDNTGLRRFKLGWGTQEHIIDYYRYDLRRDAFVTETSLVNNSHRCFFSMMPIPLLRVFGSLLYRHVG